MNDVLERLAERGTPAGAEVMVDRVAQELAGVLPTTAARRRRPWLAGAAAATLVVVTIGGGAWLLARSGDERPTPAALPTGDVAWPEFEMWFELLPPGQEPAASRDEALAAGRPVERFVFRSLYEWRMETFRLRGGLGGEPVVRSGQAVHDGFHYDLGLAIEPPTPLEDRGLLPNAWLGELPPTLAWTRARPAVDSEPVAAAPKHPLAAFAAESDRMRMEFTGEGIPVLLRSSDGASFRVLSIERRPVPVAEIAAGLGDPGREPGAGEVLRRVEGDGFAVELVASGDCLDAVVMSNGAQVRGPGGCGARLGPDEALATADGLALPDGRWLAIYMGGPVADFARVEVTHPDGSVFTGDVVDGYWLVAVPAEDPPGVIGFRAFDATGEEVSAAEILMAPPE